MSTLKTAKEIIEKARLLHGRGWLAAADGNISVRISKNEILITPKGKPKAFLKASEMVRLKLNKAIPENASSETQMHLAVYEKCPEAKAVVHCHPPVSIAWTIACPEMTELPAECISELILAVGRVPIVPYARPTTAQMGKNLEAFLPNSRVMILARHGALSWGESLMEAYLGIERLEHSATVLSWAKTLGGLTTLPSAEVKWLREMRSKIGDRTL